MTDAEQSSDLIRVTLLVKAGEGAESKILDTLNAWFTDGERQPPFPPGTLLAYSIHDMETGTMSGGGNPGYAPAQHAAHPPALPYVPYPGGTLGRLACEMHIAEAHQSGPPITAALSFAELRTAHDNDHRAGRMTTPHTHDKAEGS